jgi:lipoprotein-releasing system ATP-binding protein
MSGEALLQLDQVDKDYVATDGSGRLPILRGVNLRVCPGDAWSIVGPSGSGKTTLLNVLGTLDRPDRGRVLLEGQDLSHLDDEGLARVRNQSMGWIFQFHHLLPHLTVLENVLVPTLAWGRSQEGPGATARAEQWLGRVGLGARVDHRPGQLSGGERQRVAVVRALMNQPKILLADEPTGALDQRSARDLGHLLKELNQQEGVTLVVVTHSLELARDLGRVLELRDGALKEVA